MQQEQQLCSPGGAVLGNVLVVLRCGHGNAEEDAHRAINGTLFQTL